MKRFVIGFFLLTFVFTSADLVGQWEQLSNTGFDRNHGIGFSINGMGYVLTGGENGGYSSKSFHRYDPATDVWEQLEDYPGPERGYSIGAVWEDKLYFGFGSLIDLNNNIFEDYNDLWVYDPADNSFTELPTCPCVPRAHPAFVIVDNVIYMGTGSGPTGDLNDWWAYDIGTMEWTQLANIPGNRHHPYMFEIDGEIYVGSGHRRDWYHYDIDGDTWLPIADLDDRVAGTQFSYNGKGYALSGVDNNHDNYSTGQFWMYDPEVNEWSELEPHPGISRWAPASFIIDNYVYLVAGWSRINEEQIVWRYDLDPGTISSVEQNNVNDLFEIFPNPVGETVNIKWLENAQSKDLELDILDAKGQLLFHSNGMTNSINVENYEAGIYYLQITNDTQVQALPFVKE